MQGPTERAAVDDVDQHRREHRAHRQGQQAGDQAHQAGLQADHAPQLSGRQPVGAEDAQFPAALQLQRHQGAEHPDKGHRDRQQAQHAGDHEGAVEYLDGGLADRPVGADQNLLAGWHQGADIVDQHLRRHTRPGDGGSPGDQAVVPVFMKGAHAHLDQPEVRYIIIENPDNPESPYSPISGNAHRVPNAQVAAVSISFGNDHYILMLQPWPDCRRISVLELVAQELLADQAGADDVHDAVSALDHDFAVHVDRCHPGQPADLFDKGRVHGAVITAGDQAGGGDVNIRFQAALEPLHHGGAEAAHHSADPHRRCYRHAQGGDGHAGAAEMGGDVAGRHPPEHSEKLRHQRAKQAHRQRDHQRRPEGEADDQQQNASITQGDIARGEPEDRRPGRSQQQAEEGQARQAGAQFALQAGAVQRITGGGAGSLPGRFQRGQHRCTDAQSHALEQAEPGEFQRLHRDHKIEVVDGAGDQLHQPFAEQDTQP